MKITSLNDMDNYELPRNISFSLKLNIMFGTVHALLGIVFFLTGSIFVLIFAANSDLNFSNPLKENAVTTKAIITAVSGTNSKVNEQPVLKYTYKFLAKDNKEYFSDSYSQDPQSHFEQDTVLIEYASSNPTFSNIKNMRKAPFGASFFLITLIFPLIGVGFLIFTFYKGKKNISLVKNGYLTTGKIIGKEPTLTRINDRTVYKMFFEYTGNDGILRKASTKTHKPELVTDEEKEKLLFNIERPEEAILVDALPRAVKKFFMKLENGSLSQIQ